MLNIFWIHSHITYLLAKEIISKLDITDNIILFLSRNYTLPENISNKKMKVVNYPWFRENNTGIHNILVKKNIFKTRKNVKACQETANSYIKNREFILYIPTSWEQAVALLMLHPLCKKYFYIEEGSLSYVKEGNKLRQSGLRKIIAKYLYNIPYMGMLEKLPNFGGTYATSDNAFEWNKNNKMIISIQKEDEFYSQYSHLNNILIFDHLSMSIPELTIFANLLCDFLFTNNITNLAYKLHPSTKGEIDKETIIREKLQKIDAYELPSDFIVELFLIGRSVSLYSFNSVSSLTIYANRLGSKSFLIKRNSLNKIELFPLESI